MTAVGYYTENRDKCRQAFAEWASRNPDKVAVYREQEKAAIALSPERTQKRRERARQWRLANPERHKEQKRKYYQKNRQLCISRAIRRQKEKAAEVRHSRLSWYARTIDIRRASGRLMAQRRRARMVSAVGFYVLSQWIAKVEFYGFRCYYCKSVGTIGSLHQEHAIPISRGGSNWISNIVPSCKSCNCKKGSKTIFEFVALARINEVAVR